ncbi:hypothetical protein M758_6G078300 [Ceratodon purpureus]|nr:hypothetical protein M758_6G078300 [Ceratodon purpureus]
MTTTITRTALEITEDDHPTAHLKSPPQRNILPLWEQSDRSAAEQLNTPVTAFENPSTRTSIVSLLSFTKPPKLNPSFTNSPKLENDTYNIVTEMQTSNKSHAKSAITNRAAIRSRFQLCHIQHQRNTEIRFRNGNPNSGYVSCSPNMNLKLSLDRDRAASSSYTELKTCVQGITKSSL